MKMRPAFSSLLDDDTFQGTCHRLPPKELTSVAYWQAGKTEIETPINGETESNGINGLVDRQLIGWRRIPNLFWTLSTNNSFCLTCRVCLSWLPNFIVYIYTYIHICVGKIKLNQVKYPGSEEAKWLGSGEGKPVETLALPSKQNAVALLISSKRS